MRCVNARGGCQCFFFAGPCMNGRLWSKRQRSCKKKEQKKTAGTDRHVKRKIVILSCYTSVSSQKGA